MRKRIPSMIVVLLGVLLAGCGSLIPTPTPTPTATHTPTPTLTLTPSPTLTPSLTPTPAPVILTEDDWESVTLTLTDLQPGFTVNQDQTGAFNFDDLIAQGSPITANHLNEDGFFPFYRIVYERVRLEGIVSVTNVLLMLKDDNEATLHLERFVEFRPALVLEPVSFESFGQESVAYYGLSSDRILDIYAIGIRERNLVGEVFILTVRGTADFDEMTEYIAIFAERLHEVATGAQ